ncbi:MAG: MarR family transcriptional regulator [Chloroflexi bacterium]|nr:MarR family transcriptional regulator [Chloroflexota bacterium]
MSATTIVAGVGTLPDDLLRLARLLRRHTNPVRRGELTAEQYWLLRQLGRRGPLKVRQLAAGLGLTPSSVTIASKRLERDRLLSRERQGDDERVVLVALTARGREQLARWRQGRHDAAARLLSPLTPDERQQLEHLVARVLEVAQDQGLMEDDEEGAEPYLP